MNLNFVKSIDHSDVCHFWARVKSVRRKAKRRKLKLNQFFLKRRWKKMIVFNLQIKILVFYLSLRLCYLKSF